MARPKKKRIVQFNQDVSYFKPRGVPMFDLEEVLLTIDEREALRLADFQCLSHEEAGKKMGVSRTTFGRIIKNARKVVSDAIINGKAIKVEGGNYQMISKNRIFRCFKCNHRWDELQGTGRPSTCPSCGQNDLKRIKAL